jgi:hypothetical protein
MQTSGVRAARGKVFQSPRKRNVEEVVNRMEGEGSDSDDIDITHSVRRQIGQRDPADISEYIQGNTNVPCFAG